MAHSRREYWKNINDKKQRDKTGIEWNETHKKHVYDRHSILPISYLSKLIGLTKPMTLCTINGVLVKISSSRHEVFNQRQSCVTCGVHGMYLAIERSWRSAKMPKHVEQTYHINMYGINNQGNEVLMTKDHIIPKSKGGRNHIDNYVTMCTKCNTKKGNKL